MSEERRMKENALESFTKWRGWMCCSLQCSSFVVGLPLMLLSSPQGILLLLTVIYGTVRMRKKQYWCSPSALPPAVVPFMDVYNKSMCRTREMLVDIFQEYPDEIEHTYIPSCVVLMRCAGCCNDEALECVTTETKNVTMEVSANSNSRRDRWTGDLFTPLSLIPSLSYHL